ncbi:motile sperm domain-containing protein 2-like isoform X3 [Siniperca chuatsi]|uniref:motile sperm domain-containing protein 2-like isoform X3 n=1 Tax=Siniperca chuatsi TaxID=119488 RepID=UPI001CE04E41|nr:motile sperm domain-containing protein 2-like isoform X3 [Siniperca chuatsi]XP_044044483.1 motile sperm domain-containing protein 2-like isoform X3 [Siniperca chuatsi]
MAAEMEPSTTDGEQDLATFCEEIPQSKMINQSLKCPVWQDVKPVLRLTTKNYGTPATSNGHQNIHVALLQVMASSRRLERKLDHCLWTQKVFIVLVMAMTALWGFTLYIHYSAGYFSWTTAKN